MFPTSIWYIYRGLGASHEDEVHSFHIRDCVPHTELRDDPGPLLSVTPQTFSFLCGDSNDPSPGLLNEHSVLSI